MLIITLKQCEVKKCESTSQAKPEAQHNDN